MVVGARGVGKTYGLMRYLIEHNRSFIYLRRLKSQLDQCVSADGNPFKKLNTDIGCNIIPKRTSGGVLFMDNDKLVAFEIVLYDLADDSAELSSNDLLPINAEYITSSVPDSIFTKPLAFDLTGIMKILLVMLLA